MTEFTEGNRKRDSTMSKWPKQWLAEGEIPNELNCKHDMQFYQGPLSGTVDWKFFQNWCTQRIIILVNVMKIKSVNAHRTPAQCRDELITFLKRYTDDYDDWINLFTANGSDADTKLRILMRKMDNLSHTALRIFFIDGCEASSWFEQMECLLFRWRLEALDDDGVIKFMDLNNMQCPVLSIDEKNRLKHGIAPLMDDPSKFDVTTFYKVSAVEVPELLRTRSVHLEKGIAFLSRSQLRPFIHYRFTRILSKHLEDNDSAYEHVSRDARFVTLGRRLRKFVKDYQYKTLNNVSFSVDNLDEVSKTAFPPCMRRIHEGLKERSHLRYGARRQFTVFLKSIGIPADDMIGLYQKHFCPKMTEAGFRKEHYYRFRHFYGLEGSRIQYENDECINIAEGSNIGPNDCHGCFFANRDIEDLAKNLEKWKISHAHTENIKAFTQTKEYGKACAEYFHAVLEYPVIYPIEKPDHFVIQSRLVREKAKNEDPFFEPNDSDDMMD
ncbi:DNA primase large subunit-like [Venturia canescens]|uniref:DNA primase large subunit-like n=1 Tax=Venturia canescens TaxID=32260 RepID=UPI001C9C2957|nr:DNA primase large subunit-like [Venturia canescens]